MIFKHPEIAGILNQIKEALKKPDVIRRSKYNKNVLLYYKFIKKRKRYLSVVVRIFNGEGLVLTSYVMDRIKVGEKI